MSMPKLKRYDDDDIAHLAQVLAQHLSDELKAQFEIFDDVHDSAKRLPGIEQRVTATEADIKTLQALARVAHRDIRGLQAVAHSH